MIFSFLKYLLRINSQNYENTITGSELVSWWKYLVLMELISLYLWSEGKEWVRRSCRASSYIIYLCNQSFQCTDQHNWNGPHTQQGAFTTLFLLLLHLQGQNGIYLKVYNSETTYQLLALLSPGLLDPRSPFCSGREALSMPLPTPQLWNRDKCQFGIYL